MITTTPGSGLGLTPVDDPSAQSVSRGPDTAGAPWPTPELWPADDAPAIEWALFYRDVLGLEANPTPHGLDVAYLARHLFVKAADAWRGDHSEDEPPEDVRAMFWDDAREEAEKSRRGPCGWALARRARAEMSDIDFRAMWTDAGRSGPQSKASERGICIALGRSSRGWPFAQVDCDVKHGADLAGEYASLHGPADRSPSGGLHVYVRNPGIGEGRVYASANVLAPGVEVRTCGYAVVPAGQGGDQERRWLRRDEAQTAPETMRRPPPRAVRGGGFGDRSSDHEDRSEGSGCSGRGSSTLADPVEQDERNQKLPVVVGILARPRALPADIVSAVLACLIDARAAGSATSEETTAEVQAWRQALTRGPRDEVFAAEVVWAWLVARYVGRSPWKHGEVVRVVRSLWQTSARRQDAREGTLAGAEDFSAGDPVWCEARDAAAWPAAPVGAPAATATSSPTTTSERLSAPTPEPTSAPAPPPVYPLVPPTATAATTRGGEGGESRAPVIDYDNLFVSLYDDYTEADELAADLRRPVSFAKGPPFHDFVRGGADERYPWGYGFGPHLGRALPGLSPGDCIAFGAASSKGGKTFTVGQLAEGLAIATARRLLGEPDYADAPIVLVFWLTEMPKPGELQRRFVARHLGAHGSAFAQGAAAAEYVPGLYDAAGKVAWSPEEVVARARTLRSYSRRDELDRARWPLHGGAPEWPEMSFHAAHRLAMREIIRNLQLFALPEPEGHGPRREVHDAGPRLVAHCAESIRRKRDAFCAKYGIAVDDVLVIAVVDPGQRFADDGHDAKRGLDALLGALHKHICRPERTAPDGSRRGGLNACVLFTSDTTKAAVREMSLGRFCHDAGAVVAAEIFAGSNLIQHVADTVGIFATPNPDGRTALVWIRVLLVRNPGAPIGAFPFEWDLATGRLRALDPAAVPLPAKPAPRDGAGWGQGGDRGGQASGPRQPPIGVPHEGGGHGFGGGTGGANGGGGRSSGTGRGGHLAVVQPPRVIGLGGWTMADYPTTGDVLIDLDKVTDEAARAEFLALHPAPSWDPLAGAYRVGAAPVDRWVRRTRAAWRAP